MLRRLFFNFAYYQRPIWDTGISPPELLTFITTHQPGRALELGCGTGTNALSLAKAGWRVTAVDFAYRAIQIAKRKAQREGAEIDFHWENVTRLKSINGPFDLILDIGCFHSLSTKDHANYIANLLRLLSPQGTYLVYVFFKNQAEVLGPGITEEAVQNLSQKLKLVQRADSTERGFRPSAWMSFQKYT